MPINTSAIGAEFDPCTIIVSAEMLRSFSASLACTRTDGSSGQERESAEISDAYCVSLEWRVFGSMPTNLGISGDERLKAVHAGQDTIFHRSLCPGETVTVSGKIIDVRSTRAGALISYLISVIGAGGDDPVSTSRITSLYRGIQTDAPRRATRENAESPAPPSETATRVTLPVARDLPHRYSEGSNIWNPIHTDTDVARRAGLPDIIVHGSALWALAWQELNASFGRPTRLSGRFSAMVIPGRHVTLVHSRPDPESGTVSFCLETDDGQIAISGGRAEFARDADH